MPLFYDMLAASAGLPLTSNFCASSAAFVSLYDSEVGCCNGRSKPIVDYVWCVSRVPAQRRGCMQHFYEAAIYVAMVLTPCLIALFTPSPRR